MRFVPEETLKTLSKASDVQQARTATPAAVQSSSAVEQGSVKPKVGGSNPPFAAKNSSQPSAQTLFELDANEEMVTAQDVGNSILIVTNRRVVSVTK